MEWQDKAAQLKFDEGVSWTNLPGELELIYGQPFTYDQVRNAVRRMPEYELNIGHEERKPGIMDDGDSYIITSGKRDVTITKNKLRQLKEYYCGDDTLTINQICRKLDIPRRDFHLIKTAFSITHDDIPYIDDDLQNKELDDLVNETLEKRKEKYFIKLQQGEINQLKKEVAAYRKQEYFADKIHSIVTEHIESFADYYQGPALSIQDKKKSNLMLEVPIVDLHLGKLAWRPETGENYDYKIADKRFMYVINDVAQRVEGQEFEKVLMPIGNDFFNFDTMQGTTAAGTSQDNDLRWQKLFSKGVEMLIKAIDIFYTIAPVEVLQVPGNHDKMTSFYTIKYLAAWFKSNPNVKVNTDPKTRKYVEFGKCLIGFTHGDKEKKRIFGNMQVEAAEAWGRTKYREWHAGHLHSEHVKEEHGIIVRNLSSTTGTDCWHYESGYVGAVAKNESFIWDKEKGLQEILFTNI